ncbi:DNA mismatch repair endonuclease MutL [soil metagenome]
MARRIEILPDRLVNQIAAGEVVERPAAVVKELMENALDAGAMRIDLAVRNGGKTEIRVADDGCGMIREDAMLALERHATSKIRELDDLATLRSLGFRGEALPSIASVSRLALETAARDTDGTRIVISGGQISAVEPCARRRGTTVTVRSLFFNVPARAAFLRSAAAEMRAVREVVTALALAHPQVAFALESNGRALLDLPSATDLRHRIAAIWEDETAEELIPVSFRDDRTALSGLVQRPAAATPGGRRAYLFVDGRAFTDRALVRAANRAYRTTIPPGAHPSVFLFIEVPPGGVDVNVHPTKAEVRFRDSLAVERAVEEGVRSALSKLESAPAVGRAAGSAEFTTVGRTDPPAAEISGPADRNIGEPTMTDLAVAAEPQMSLFVAASASARASAPEEPEALELTESRSTAPSIWQIHNMYLLAETRTGLIIVDQHSAHERVLYEELMRGFGEGGGASQRLLFPLTLRLSPAELGIVEELSGVLARAGFEIESFGGRSVVVHAVPNPHPYFDAERCLREMISELATGSPLVNAARNQHERIALSFACKAAIKAGQKLSPEEMSELFDRLFATELPYHDIHGRPTVVQLSIRELHNRFGRSGG